MVEESLKESYRKYCEWVDSQPPKKREFYINVNIAKAFTNSFTPKQLRNFDGVFYGNSEAIKIIEDYIYE